MAISSDDGFRKSKYIIMEFEVEDIAVTYDRENNGKVSDISLEIEVKRQKKDGTTQKSKVFIDGKFKRDARGIVEGWGSGFRIKEFVLACVPGLKFGVDDLGRITDDVWDKCKGKSFHLLKYISLKDDGTETYRNYTNFAADAPGLEKKFFKDVENDRIYKYEPSLATDADTSFPFPEVEDGKEDMVI